MPDSLNVNPKPKVLLVDDDELVLMVLQDQLARRYDCTALQDPREALALLATESFDVIVSDQVMPHLSGDQLLTRAYQNWPDTERILITGYADVSSMLRAVNDAHIAHYLAKPWSVAELLQVVGSAAQRARKRRSEREQLELAAPDRGQALQALEEGRKLVRELAHGAGLPATPARGWVPVLPEGSSPSEREQLP